VRPQGRRRRGPTSLLFSSPPPLATLPDGLPHPWRRQSSTAGLIRIRPWGGRIRALGVRICPLGPRCAGERRWRRRLGLPRSFGGLRCGSLAAALAAGRTPRPGRAASAWLRAGAQGLPVGLQEEDGRIPGTRSPPNPSSRDQIRCLHGQIRFSLTGSSRLEGGSTTPQVRFVVTCMVAPPAPHLFKRRDPTTISTARVFHRVYDRLNGARKSQHGYGGERRSSW
jgi:hypothetical protein